MDEKKDLELYIEDAAEEYGLREFPIIWRECGDSEIKTDVNYSRRCMFVKAFRQGANWLFVNKQAIKKEGWTWDLITIVNAVERKLTNGITFVRSVIKMGDWGKWHDLIECPWCGWVDKDSWERNGQDGYEINCEDCDRPMTLSVDFEVRYATEKVEKNQARSTQQNNQKLDN